MAMEPAAKRKKLYSEGVVRLGSRGGTCEMKLYPLVTHSVLIRRHAESICESESNLLIELPACPGGPDIFGTVQDFCYGLMDENAISISNVVGLAAISSFLEMDGLACKALKFLEECVFVSWESCLRVLATFDCNDACNILDDADENSLFHKCKNAFLLHVRIPIPIIRCFKSGTATMCCSVRCLVRVAELLSPSVAEHIYKCCRSEQLGLCSNFEASDQSESDYVKPLLHIPLCIHVRGIYVRGWSKFTIEFDGADVNYEVDCLEGLSELLPSYRTHRLEGLSEVLPNLSRRATLVVHLAKSMLLGDNVKIPSGTICLSRFRWSFLCDLLGVISDLPVAVDKRDVPQDLEEVTEDLRRMVSRGIRDLFLWNPETDCITGDRNTDWIVRLESIFSWKCIQPFNAHTLRLVLRHFRSLSFNQLTVSLLAKILDSVLKRLIQINALTVRQALLIYQELPNNDRLSHEGIYHVFQDSLKRRLLSTQDVRDLTQLLNYQKLPDDIVVKLFEELQTDCDPQLLQWYLAIQENRIQREKSADLIKITEYKLSVECRLDKVVEDLEAEKEKSTLAERKLEEVLSGREAEKSEMANVKLKLERAVRGLNAEKQKTALEKCKFKEVVRSLEAEKLKMTVAKRKLEAEKKKTTVAKRKLEAEKEKTTLVEHRLNEVKRSLEAETEKTTCQICFERPRDAVSFPCMHFMYCKDCLELAHEEPKPKICPTCRSSTSKVEKCFL